MSIFFLALLPILGWGFMPIVANLKKSTPYEQLLGTSLSALILFSFYHLVTQQSFSLLAFLVGIGSGVFWSFGQLLQFKAINKSSVSKIMPISNGTQLIFTTMAAVIFFQEWSNQSKMTIGIISLVIIVFGMILTSYSPNTDSKVGLSPFYMTIFSSLALTVYVIINRVFQINPSEIFLSQSIGMLIASSLIYLRSNPTKFNVGNISFNLLTGALWSAANFGMLSINSILGVSLGYSISQICVIVSTLGGIIIFKEKKSKYELALILLGVLMIMFGVIFLSTIR